jgi:threonine/homoserine/homoserine lactone efflux protein
MDAFTLLAFTIAYAIAVVVPGPGIAAVVARALGSGFWGAVPMVIGILAGDLIYLVFALFGLAAIANWFGPLFTVIRWASAAYLLFIAWQFWTARPGAEQIGAKAGGGAWRTFLGGLALTLGNPKTIVFFLALLPTVVPLDRPISLLGFGELLGIVFLVLPLICLTYAALAAAARDFFRSTTAIRRLNRTAAAIMAGAAALIAVRE